MALSTTGAGRRGEALAEQYLVKRGYIPLARNYRSGPQEIDLIMQAGEIIVFVEVKARSSGYYGRAAEAITPKKQAFLRKAALAYLAETNQLECFTRFDAIEVDLRYGKILHIPNAF